VAPGWPFGLPGLRPDLPRSDFGDGFAGPSDDGGFDEFREFVFTWAARSATWDCQRRHQLAQRRVLRGLLLDPRVPLGQQLPHPRVRSTQPGSIISSARNPGHVPHCITSAAACKRTATKPAAAGSAPAKRVQCRRRTPV
jgi:hypothetical protein